MICAIPYRGGIALKEASCPAEIEGSFFCVAKPENLGSSSICKYPSALKPSAGENSAGPLATDATEASGASDALCSISFLFLDDCDSPFEVSSTGDAFLGPNRQR